MFDLDTIEKINNEAVQKHLNRVSRADSLRKRLEGKLPASRLANFSDSELENAAYYLL